MSHFRGPLQADAIDLKLFMIQGKSVRGGRQWRDQECPIAGWHSGVAQEVLRGSFSAGPPTKSRRSLNRMQAVATNWFESIQRNPESRLNQSDTHAAARSASRTGDISRAMLSIQFSGLLGTLFAPLTGYPNYRYLARRPRASVTAARAHCCKRWIYTAPLCGEKDPVQRSVRCPRIGTV